MRIWNAIFRVFLTLQGCLMLLILTACAVSSTPPGEKVAPPGPPATAKAAPVLVTGALPGPSPYPAAPLPVASGAAPVLETSRTPGQYPEPSIPLPVATATAPATEGGVGLAPTPDLSATLATLDDNPQQAALLHFILTELAGTEKQHLLVAQVKPNPLGLRDPLSLQADNILRAWLYQEGVLYDAPQEYYAQSYLQEPTGPWKYAYMAFSLNAVSPDFTTATVRIDRIPGLAGGKGELYELGRSGEQWTVQSSRITWTQ